MASAQRKAQRAAEKTQATAQRAAANQAKTQARQGSGKSAAQNLAEANRGGRAISLTITERLGFSDTTQTAQAIHRDVGVSGGSSRPIQEQQITRETKTSGVPTEVIQKKEGKKLAVTLDERLNITSQERKPTGIPSSAAGLLYGAETISVLRKQTEEQRRQENTIIQVSQGAAEGIGGLGASIVSFGIASAKELEGLATGKGFGQSKEFVEFVKGELRPSTISQAFSQIDPFATEKQPISFDPTSLSRGVGELASLAFGSGGGVKVTGAKALPRTPGKFTSTKIKIPAEEEGVKMFARGEGPAYIPEIPQLYASIKLGKGVGKTLLREPTPRRSPFGEDKATPTSGAGQFVGRDYNLGRGTSKYLERTQRQRSGQETIVQQKPISKPQQEILFSKPRFDESQYKQSAGGYVSETIRYPKSAPTTLMQEKPIQQSFTSTKDLERQARETTQIRKTSQDQQLTPRLGRGVLPKEGFGFKEDITTVTTRLIPPTQTPKITTRQTPSFKIDTPYRQTTRQIQPPIQRPPEQPRIPEPILRPPRFAFPFVPKASFFSGGYGDKANQRKVYSAFGISEDINVKYIERVLPNTKAFKVSTRPVSFRLEDIKAQKTLYGILGKRKSYKRKKGKSKRK